jgi:hypothetical protein
VALGAPIWLCLIKYTSKSHGESSILVGGFKPFFIFHNIWDVILPIDEYFFKMVKTTNQYTNIAIENSPFIEDKHDDLPIQNGDCP